MGFRKSDPLVDFARKAVQELHEAAASTPDPGGNGRHSLREIDVDSRTGP
jgi:hypothetical protein